MTVDELMQHRPGPGLSDRRASSTDGQAIRDAYHDRPRRRSRCARRATIERATSAARAAIVVTEIPYQVNKAPLIEKIAELVREKKLDGISDMRDESDRDGMRMVIELKRDDAQIVLNQLYKHTALQTTFGVNMLALVDRRPQGADAQADARALHRLPPGGRDPPHALRAAHAPRSARTSWKASGRRSTTSTR